MVPQIEPKPGVKVLIGPPGGGMEAEFVALEEVATISMSGPVRASMPWRRTERAETSLARLAAAEEKRQRRLRKRLAWAAAGGER